MRVAAGIDLGTCPTPSQGRLLPLPAPPQELLLEAGGWARDPGRRAPEELPEDEEEEEEEEQAQLATATARLLAALLPGAGSSPSDHVSGIQGRERVAAGVAALAADCLQAAASGRRVWLAPLLSCLAASTLVPAEGRAEVRQALQRAGGEAGWEIRPCLFVQDRGRQVAARAVLTWGARRPTR